MGFLTYPGYKPFMEPISDLSTQALKKIQDMVYLDMRSSEKIKAAMKENEALYGKGEITNEDYEKIKSRLIRDLEFTGRLEEALKKDEELYAAGKITREEFERRKSEITDEFDHTKPVKKTGKGRYMRWR